MSIKIKELMEILVAAVSLSSFIGAAGFWLAAIKIKNELQSCDLSQGAKFQRQYDRNKIEIGLLKTRIRSLEKFAAANLGFHEREEFPPDSLPSEEDTQGLEEMKR